MTKTIYDESELIRDLHPLNRSICSPDLDRALEIIKEKYIPELIIDSYPTGAPAWTWNLPKKWELRNGYIAQNGKKIISTSTEPLCVWSGSLPVNRTVTFSELKEHIYSEPERPDLLCWYFRYYGNLDWGFNLPYNLFRTLDPDSNYEVLIDARYYADDFRAGYVRVPGKSDRTVLITSNICHPFQCNDSLTGAAVAYALFEFLKKQRPYFTYLFTFVPETIGTIALLANHADWIPKLIYHLYTEFWGNSGSVRFQRSLRGDTVLDHCVLKILHQRFGSDFQALPFRQGGIINDENVTSMPNLFIPSVALNRGMFPEYHTHKDIPERLNFDLVHEGTSIMKDILLELDGHRDIDFASERGSYRIPQIHQPKEDIPEDFIPVPSFTGPVCLSKYDLWVDWRRDPELNAAIDMIMSCLDGKNSVAEIASFLQLPFATVKNCLERFEVHGLVTRSPIVRVS